MNQTPTILISNDDGIHAPGILNLVEAAREFGDVVIVAPDSAQSGMGHAISVGKPLRMYKEEISNGMTGYAVSGTPADCVKLATGVLLEKAPDLILSGINHGSNSSVSSLYSGTLSAAREGAIQGIPSIGFSLCNYSHEADMTASREVVRHILRESFRQKLNPGALLSVNIPNLPFDRIKGFRVTRMAMGRWVEEFDQRVDPYGQKYYWLTGKYARQDDREDTDEFALAAGYVSITPMTHDLTAYEEMSRMQHWSFD
ncbi:MAG: 5'/3'-nucleotidase SurE [Bacteroidia bacterium]|nr:5'/3'-nucleotidase SurE [Bacteroidia bacterium]